MSTPDLQFAPVAATPLQFIEAARAFLGLEYSTTGTYSQPPLGQSDINAATGRTDCAGILLLAARRMGLWPEDFPVDLAWSIFQRERAELLVEVLTRNFVRVELEDLQIGDVMFLRYANAAGNDPGGRHLAIKTEDAPAPFGKMIHCWCDFTGSGRVFEQRVSQADWNCVRRAWRMKNFSF